MRTQQALPVGSFFASQLFGDKVPEQTKAIVRNFKKPTSRPKKDVATRKERVIFLEVTENTPPVKAIQPLLTKEAKAKTMDNYRSYVAIYNDNIRSKNDEIEKFNKTVRSKIINKKLSEVQKEYSKLFYIKNARLRPKKYNDLAEKFNLEYDNCVELKKLQPIKYSTEIIFFQLLHLYSMQMELKTQQYINLGISEISTVPQFEINTHHVTNLKRQENFSIDVSNRTIRNHKERLEEAGILYHYYFQGHKKGVKMHINSQILVVFDAKTSLLTNAENQAINPTKGKMLPYNNDTTRTLENNINKRENRQADFLNLGTPSAGFSFSFYENAPPQDVDSKLGAAAESVKVSETLSEMLENSIIPDQQLAQNLSAGIYNNYSRIKKTVFDKEAYHGTMSREDFKTLIIQEFFKNAAKLWRDKRVFVGSWKIAINDYMEKTFLSNNGNGSFLYSKQLMADKLEEMLWRINNAAKWFNKTKINPLFPNQYFDFTRKTSKEIGFEYTANSFRKHQQYMATKPLKDKEVLKKASVRAVKIDHAKKFDRILSRFNNNRISLTEMIEYVNNNLPPEFLKIMHKRLISKNLGKNQF